ncbi:phasin family protein [Piscinibacter sp. HJYY11]|uniref:phasin family protein n=1 Tax=Piscinibacter sp. HJYY11 TaxID=2801333 RepID=UPI00191F537F|nr:phasin family protein [Piscinibacter sp. HJYY11]MBL0726448.1 phasin family protein [Piscinibacter sp. HJYY11]
MASRNQKAAASRTSAPAASMPMLAAAESSGFAMAQEQMQSLMSLADVVLKRAEELRRCQLETAQQARRRHDKARADVASAGNPTELLNVQAELLRDDLESASQYWQRMTSICTAAQAETLEHMTRAAGLLARAAGTATTPENGSVGKVTEAASTEKPDGAEAAQAWNRWVDLGRQWSDMLYRTEAALH